MLSREGKQTDRGAVGAEFIGYNRRRREALLLQEFPHQPNCRPSVPAGLNQEIQDFALTVHGTPEIELPPSNYDDHLVQVPAFGRSWPPTLNPPRIGPTEFQDPSSNCLIRDVETTLGKQVLNVPIAQRETAIEPDGMLDDDRWKAVTTVGYLAHPETLKHRPCRSHAVNVTMPPQVLLAHHLKTLKLPTFLREYDKLARQCATEGADHVRYLVRLTELELIDRERRMVERRIRQARFPAVKSLDSFDFKAIASLNKMLVLELARCEYVERRENIIALGNSGTGKTHIALGLGLAACQKGLSVGFLTAAALVHELMEARDEKRLLRLQKQLAKYHHHRRTRLRAALEDRCRAAVRSLQPALRAGLDPGDLQLAVR